MGRGQGWNGLGVTPPEPLPWPHVAGAPSGAVLGPPCWCWVAGPVLSLSRSTFPSTAVVPIRRPARGVGGGIRNRRFCLLCFCLINYLYNEATQAAVTSLFRETCISCDGSGLDCGVRVPGHPTREGKAEQMLPGGSGRLTLKTG